MHYFLIQDPKFHQYQNSKVNYPCKLYIDFRNWTNVTILVKIEGFKLYKGINADPNATRDSSSGLIEVKFIENASQTNERCLNPDAIIRHGENKKVWIPLDPNQDINILNKQLHNGNIGKLIAEILWFDKTPQYTRFRPIIKR